MKHNKERRSKGIKTPLSCVDWSKDIADGMTGYDYNAISTKRKLLGKGMWIMTFLKAKTNKKRCFIDVTAISQIMMNLTALLGYLDKLDVLLVFLVNEI